MLVTILERVKLFLYAHVQVCSVTVEEMVQVFMELVHSLVSLKEQIIQAVSSDLEGIMHGSDIFFVTSLILNSQISVEC